jgi:hypothetical protein
MIITQVHLVLGTIKGHFDTQHNATDISNVKGACNWYADIWNVHPPELLPDVEY